METTHLRRLAAVPVLAVLLAITACSAGGGDGDSSDAGGSVSAGTSAEDESSRAEDANRSASDSAVEGEYAAAPAANVVETQEQAIISKGVVSLVGVDVAGDRFDVQKVVDAHDGEVVEEKNQTNEDGEMTRSRLVIRIPVADFDATMSELEKVAQLASSSRDSEDVTTEVIDTEVRIRAQSESLKRVELLLAQAQSIRDIVAIEAQLTRRQAELDSLKSRQAYLADQTSLSTITVFLEKKPEKTAAKKAEEDDSGFFAGLGDGWDGMKTFLVGLATVTGTLLPFAVLLLVLGVPTWLVVRNISRRRPPHAATAAAGPPQD